MHFGRSSVICWLNRLSFSPQLTQCTMCIWGGSISGGFIHWLMLYDRKQVAAQVVGSTPRLFTKCRRTIPVQISYEGNSVFNWMWYRPSHAVTPKHRAELLPTQLHRTVYAVGLSNHNVEFCLVSCNKPLKPHLIQTTSHRQASIHNICQTHTWLQYTTNTIYVAVLQENVCVLKNEWGWQCYIITVVFLPLWGKGYSLFRLLLVHKSQRKDQNQLCIHQSLHTLQLPRSVCGSELRAKLLLLIT